jgi:ABC-type dipeptide/oligopeptide/nickel transport system permease component
MFSYIIRRLLLMIPTLVGILTITFIVIQFVPGGPIDQMKSVLRGHSGVLGEVGGGPTVSQQGNKAQEMDPRHLEALKRIYHLDRPTWERYLRTRTKAAPSRNVFSIATTGMGFFYLNSAILFTGTNPSCNSSKKNYPFRFPWVSSVSSPPI